MTDEIKEKRAKLRLLSKSAKELVEMGEAESINEGLIKIYAVDGHLNLKSFKEWLKFGKVVKKGEKALLLWGKPLRKKNDFVPNQEVLDEYDFFPLAYVFSNLQVEQKIERLSL